MRRSFMQSSPPKQKKISSSEEASNNSSSYNDTPPRHIMNDDSKGDGCSCHLATNAKDCYECCCHDPGRSKKAF